MALDRPYLDEVATALGEVLPEGVVVAVDDPNLPPEQGDMFAAEMAAIARAVPKRRAEFAAGRRAAHKAMEALGQLPSPVIMGPDRAPVWPAGLVGSISHCGSVALAVAGYEAHYAGLGIDVEPDAALPDDVIAAVTTPPERRWLAQGRQRGQAARVLFSAKECVFKLLYPMRGEMFDFADVEITLDEDGGGFSARWTKGGTDIGHSGRIVRVAGAIICVMFATQDYEIT